MLGFFFDRFKAWLRLCLLRCNFFLGVQNFIEKLIRHRLLFLRVIWRFFCSFRIHQTCESSSESTFWCSYRLLPEWGCWIFSWRRLILRNTSSFLQIRILRHWWFLYSVHYVEKLDVPIFHFNSFVLTSLTFSSKVGSLAHRCFYYIVKQNWVPTWIYSSNLAGFAQLVNQIWTVKTSWQKKSIAFYNFRFKNEIKIVESVYDVLVKHIKVSVCGCRSKYNTSSILEAVFTNMFLDEVHILL